MILPASAQNGGITMMNEDYNADVFVEDQRDDLDLLDKETLEVGSEFNKTVRRLLRANSQEKQICDLIASELDNMGFSYQRKMRDKRYFEVNFSVNNKIISFHIIIQLDKIIMRVVFPFRVQFDALALMALYCCEFNCEKAYTILDLDLDDGELSLKYAYYVPDEEHFDRVEFKKIMDALIGVAEEKYVTLSHLSMGVLHSNRALNKKILQSAVESLDGTIDVDEINYGAEIIRDHMKLNHEESFEMDGKDLGKTSREEMLRSSFVKRLLEKIEGEKDPDSECDDPNDEMDVYPCNDEEDEGEDE